MNFKELIDRHREMLEFIDEPDAFETQSEREMQKQLERDIDNAYISQEKELRKYSSVVEHILDNLGVSYTKEGKKFTCYFPNKIQYDTFMAKEKNSDRFNSCLIKPLENKKFEDLIVDRVDGLRYLTLWTR